MRPERSSPFPRPRTLVHPGPYNPTRIQSMRAERGRHFRLVLRPGATLFEGLVGPLAEMGVECASTTILGGGFERILFCVAPPDPSGKAVANYTQPIDAGRAYMIFGNATIGKSPRGNPIVHCHAAFRAEDGRPRGGHLLADQSVVGPDPVTVLVTSLDGFELRLAVDEETNIPLLWPRPVERPTEETSR